jgi:hypothetical protein
MLVIVPGDVLSMPGKVNPEAKACYSPVVELGWRQTLFGLHSHIQDAAGSVLGRHGG